MSFYKTETKNAALAVLISLSLSPSISKRQKSNNVFAEEKCTSNKSDMWEEGMLCFLFGR
jgi:hypothetical protein